MQNVLTGSWAHPALCSLGPVILSPGTERPWREFDFHVVTRLRMNGAVPPLPFVSLQRGHGQLYVYFLATRIRKFPIFVLKSNVPPFFIVYTCQFSSDSYRYPSSTLRYSFQLLSMDRGFFFILWYS